MKQKNIEKYTQEFLDIYKKNLAEVGLNETAQVMLINLLQQTMKEWIKKTTLPIRRK